MNATSSQAVVKQDIVPASHKEELAKQIAKGERHIKIAKVMIGIFFLVSLAVIGFVAYETFFGATIGVARKIFFICLPFLTISFAMKLVDDKTEEVEALTKQLSGL